MSYISWNAPFPLTISSNLNESRVEKQLYARKVLSFPTFCHHKRQYFELLVKEIKCRYSTADLCAQIYANMLISSRWSLLTGQFAQWRGRDKKYCVGELWTVSKWSRFTHEMSHSVYNLPGKTTRQKLARVPLVSVLKKIPKPKFKQHFTVNISCFETGFISLFKKAIFP